MQQQKTLIIHISAYWWTIKQPMGSVLSAELAMAVRIAELCHMDILSISHHQEEDSPDAVTTVVYLCNGMSPQDVLGQMRPEMNNKPSSYWMLLDMELWQGLINCLITVRGIDETWED